jgi:hypothetical protein
MLNVHERLWPSQPAPQLGFAIGICRVKQLGQDSLCRRIDAMDASFSIAEKLWQSDTKAIKAAMAG